MEYIEDIKRKVIGRYVLILKNWGFAALYLIESGRVQLLLKELISSGNYDEVICIGIHSILIFMPINMITGMICFLSLRYDKKYFIIPDVLFLILAVLITMIASGEIYYVHTLVILICTLECVYIL